MIRQRMKGDVGGKMEILKKRMQDKKIYVRQLSSQTLFTLTFCAEENEENEEKETPTKSLKRSLRHELKKNRMRSSHRPAQ